MSPKGRTISRRARNSLIGGGAGLVGAAVVALIAIAQSGGGEDLIPPHGGVGDTGDVIRIDLLASRDLDVSGALPAGGTSDTKPPASAQSWTRTGGESCYPISTTDASCFTSSEVPYTYAATTIDSVAYTLGWVTEPSATNRVLYSTAIDCANWTCRGTGTATPLQIAPDGSATATTITVGTRASANDVYKPAGSYTNDATIYPRAWIKCSSGSVTLTSASSATRGRWDVDCSAIGGSWMLINSASLAAVTEITAWVASATGSVGINFGATSGTVTASIWAPTLTEEPGTGLAVIPTGAAAVSTGDPAWAIDNTSGAYYVAGDTVTQTLSQITGTCWDVDGTDLLLSGASGSPCAGIWYALQVAP